MATVLTVQSVLRAKPDPSRRVEIPDAIVPGLYFVVQPSGVKSWAVRYRHRGEPRKLTIGRLGVFDLVAARDEARKALQAVAAGRDPCLDKREARRAVAAHPGRSWHFIDGMARLYEKITGKQPAKSKAGPFVRFLAAAWVDFQWPAPLDRNGRERDDIEGWLGERVEKHPSITRRKPLPKKA